MPELPEVETIRRGLEEHIVGRMIVSVDVRLKKIFEGDVESIVGAKFKSIRRFGKVLVLDLSAAGGSANLSIVIHVKMTGQLIYVSQVSRVARVPQELPHKFTHVIFKLDQGLLFYNDMRQFGWIKVIQTSKVEDLKFLKELGPEPLVGQSSSGRATLTLEKFSAIIRNKSVKIKILLMDQKKIGGVGNIYANDALFMAKIDPSRPAKSLTNDEIKNLFEAIEHVLKLAIKHGGSSENTYVNALGEKGKYQEYSLVYGKLGKPCPICGTLIKRIAIGGRGTFFCPHCQK